MSGPEHPVVLVGRPGAPLGGSRVADGPCQDGLSPPDGGISCGVAVIAVLQAISTSTAGLSVILERIQNCVSLLDWRRDLAGLALILFGFAIAAGLWRLKRWAWVAVMLWTGLTLAGALAYYLQGKPEYALMVEGVVIVFYLNQRDVQQAFATPAAGDAT